MIEVVDALNLPPGIGGVLLTMLLADSGPAVRVRRLLVDREIELATSELLDHGDVSDGLRFCWEMDLQHLGYHVCYQCACAVIFLRLGIAFGDHQGR